MRYFWPPLTNLCNADTPGGKKGYQVAYGHLLGPSQQLPRGSLMDIAKRKAYLAAAALLVASTASLGARPAEASTGSHCVAWTQPTASSLALEVVELQCYSSFSDATTAAGGSTSTSSETSTMQSSGDSIIGIHFDGKRLTGDSFTVVGSNCAGGYLNVSNYWNNRVSSTWNGCPAIRHFDGFNIIGANETTFDPGGDLWYMDNRTSSIQYLS